MTGSPQKRSSREPFRIPVGVALLVALFVAGVILVIVPEIASGGWGGLWRVVQVGGLILAGILVYRWLIERQRKRKMGEGSDSADLPEGS